MRKKDVGANRSRDADSLCAAFGREGCPVCIVVLEVIQELIRKHDYRFGDETRGNEMTAWRRGAEVCAGNPGVR